MTLIRTETLAEQIWIPRRNRTIGPRRSRIQPGKNEQPKPGGGLWTSTYATHEESGWFGWCQYEQPNWLHIEGFVLRPVECRVLTIASVEDHNEFHDTYAGPYPGMEHEWGRRGGTSLCTIDWTRIMEECDAVRLADPWVVRYGGSGRWSSTITFYGWDCESTWWARWMFGKRSRKVRLRRVACPKCDGTGWKDRKDFVPFEKWATRGECPACGGSGRVAEPAAAG